MAGCAIADRPAASMIVIPRFLIIVSTLIAYPACDLTERTRRGIAPAAAGPLQPHCRGDMGDSSMAVALRNRGSRWFPGVAVTLLPPSAGPHHADAKFTSRTTFAALSKTQRQSGPTLVTRRPPCDSQARSRRCLTYENRKDSLHAEIYRAAAATVTGVTLYAGSGKGASATGTNRSEDTRNVPSTKSSSRCVYEGISSGRLVTRFLTDRPDDVVGRVGALAGWLHKGPSLSMSRRHGGHIEPPPRLCASWGPVRVGGTTTKAATSAARRSTALAPCVEDGVRAHGGGDCHM
jgi:hypothetical protein